MNFSKTIAIILISILIVLAVLNIFLLLAFFGKLDLNKVYNFLFVYSPKQESKAEIKFQTLKDENNFSNPDYVSDELLVKFKSQTGAETINKFLKDNNFASNEEIKAGEFLVLKISEGGNVSELVEKFKTNPIIESIEPNYYFSSALDVVKEPNDPCYKNCFTGKICDFKELQTCRVCFAKTNSFHQENLKMIKMQEAWNDIKLYFLRLNKDYPKVKVAVLDSGAAFENYASPNEQDYNWQLQKPDDVEFFFNAWKLVPKRPEDKYVKDYLQHSFDLAPYSGTNIVFGYDYKFYTLGDPSLDIKIYVEISSDQGKTWEILKTYNGLEFPSELGWLDENIEISAYAGKKALIRFRAIGYDEKMKYQKAIFYLTNIIIKSINNKGESFVCRRCFFDQAIKDTGWEKTSFKRASDMAEDLFISGYNFLDGTLHPNDDSGHGTHIAGVIAQTTNNQIGTAGIASDYVKIMPVKVLNAVNKGSCSNVVKGLNFAVNNGAKIINISFGAAKNDCFALRDAINKSRQKEVIIIASCGNDSKEGCRYPAAYNDSVIAVGAVDFKKNKTYYTNYGEDLDFVAPGGEINEDMISPDLNSDCIADGIIQQSFSSEDIPSNLSIISSAGTSRAAAHVSGVVAMLLAKKPDLKFNEVYDILKCSSEDLGQKGKDADFGWGLLDAEKALSEQCDFEVSCEASQKTAKVGEKVVFSSKITPEPIMEKDRFGYYWGYDERNKGDCKGLEKNCEATFSKPGKYTANLEVIAVGYKKTVSCSVDVVEKKDCASHYQIKCLENSSYWYDSCGKKEEKIEDCSTNYCVEAIMGMSTSNKGYFCLPFEVSCQGNMCGSSYNSYFPPTPDKNLCFNAHPYFVDLQWIMPLQVTSGSFSYNWSGDCSGNSSYGYIINEAKPGNYNCSVSVSFFAGSGKERKEIATKSASCSFEVKKTNPVCAEQIICGWDYRSIYKSIGCYDGTNEMIKIKDCDKNQICWNGECVPYYK